MQEKQFKCECNKAFTLIELLVVMLIIGIVSAIAVTLFNQFSLPRRAKMQAGQIRVWLQALENRVILRGDVLKLKWQPHNVLVYRYQSTSAHKGQWQRVSSLALMPRFSESIVMRVTAKNKKILFWPNGTVTPFILKIKVGDKIYSIVKVTANGVVT